MERRRPSCKYCWQVVAKLPLWRVARGSGSQGSGTIVPKSELVGGTHPVGIFPGTAEFSAEV